MQTNEQRKVIDDGWAAEGGARVAVVVECDDPLHHLTRPHLHMSLKPTQNQYHLLICRALGSSNKITLLYSTLLYFTLLVLYLSYHYFLP